MRKLSLLAIILVAVLSINAVQPALAAFNLKKSKAPVPGRVGERIVYSVRLGLVTLGKAEFRHASRTNVAGTLTDLITFETKLTNFSDMEAIYTDAKDFLPLRVERNINNFISRERITEKYDQHNSVLTIEKKKGGKKQEMVIKKHGNIQNAILLPFYVRRVKNLSVGWTLDAVLPTQSFKIKLVNVEKVKVPAGKFECYHFQSQPPKFEIWITKDARRIPVKIKGMGSIGYVMVMKEYH